MLNESWVKRRKSFKGAKVNQISSMGETGSEHRTVKLAATELMLFSAMSLISAETKVVDLTHEISDSSIMYPIYPKYNFSIFYRSLQPGGFWLEANTIQMIEHMGTHIDAPSHMRKGGKRMADVPITRLIGPGVVLDVKAAAEKNPDYEVTVEDLQKWESKYGRIPDKAIVLMNSGWSKKYPNKTMVFNTENHDDPSTFHFPSFGLQAVTWLVANRKINLVGVDSPSLDYGQHSNFPVHTYLFKHDLPGLENVANVDALPLQGATVTVGALKIRNGSGAPVRLIAVFDDGQNAGSHASFSFGVITVALMAIYL